MQAAIHAMLSRSAEPGAEEWAIHDHEGFMGLRISEYESLARVVELAQKLANLDVEEEALTAAVQAFGDEWEQALSERYRGSYESEGDYAEELASDCHSEAELGPYRAYIDWSRLEHDMELGGEITVVVVNGARHIFTAF